MKTLKFVAPLLLCVSLLGTLANASTTDSKKAKPRKAVSTAAKPSKSAKLGTSFKMDGTALRGKYQSSLGTRATVENDKSLDDLLTGRTQFDDRIQQDSEKN